MVDHRDITLSPSAINTFYASPYKWWLTYHEKYKLEPSIHLIKGSAVHNTLEAMFEGRVWANDETYEEDLINRGLREFDKHWIGIEELDLSPDDLQRHFRDGQNMVRIFVRRMADQISSLLISGHAKNAGHGLNLIKPKFREIYLKCEELKVGGYIDSVMEEKNSGDITIIDYKTSNKFRNKLADDYARQLAIYAYLYKTTQGVEPSWVCVNYLRFGESFYILVTPQLIEWARQQVTYVRSFIDSYQTIEPYLPPEDELKSGRFKQSTGFLFTVDHERKLITSPY